MSRTSLPTVSDQAARPNATDVVIEKSPAETRADGLKLTSKLVYLGFILQLCENFLTVAFGVRKKK